MFRQLTGISSRLKVVCFSLLCSLLTLNLSVVTASLATPPERIVSLAPGITEILFAAGVGDRVVGVTVFCDYPPEARKRPKIGGMSNPSLEAVVKLRPDIVIMTTDGNPAEFRDRLRSLNIETHVFRSVTIPELPGGIKEIGKALEEEERFGGLASEIRSSVAGFTRQHAEPAGTVLFVISPEPLIVAGPRTAIDDALGILGWKNMAGAAKTRYPKFSVEAVFRNSPDIIFIGRMREDMEALSSGLLKKIAHVEAVKKGKVFFVGDGLYRLGPRIVDGMKELSKHLNMKGQD